MPYVAAYILDGKVSLAAADLEKILGSVEVEADGERLKKVISELNGKAIEKLSAQGREKLSSMPARGNEAPVHAAVSVPPVAAEENKEAKKEGRKVESESEYDDMGFGLFN